MLNPNSSKTQSYCEREFLHSVMNPLAIARGMLELALMSEEQSVGSLSADLLERLVKARTAVDRAIGVVKGRQQSVREQEIREQEVRQQEERIIQELPSSVSRDHSVAPTRIC